MSTHLWNIASNRESLWVRWIHMYKLRGRTIWDVQPRTDMSWGWRKLLQLREYVKTFFWSDIGDGKSTNLWYDRWCHLSPLINVISPRDIHREGYFMHTCVADMFNSTNWNWPIRWLEKVPDLENIIVPILTDHKDCLVWQDSSGNKSRFSVRCAWEALRSRGVECNWHNVVWFSHGIPRHSFHLWLVMRRSLKTQDMLRPWDVGPNIDISTLRCSLCKNQQDTHEHLFFECEFSSKVWAYVRGLADMDDTPPILADIVARLLPLGKSRKAKSIYGKLILAASSYLIWNERNSRLFTNRKRSPEDIRDMIMVTVRLKLLTFRFKNKPSVTRLLQRWKMPRNFRLYGS